MASVVAAFGSAVGVSASGAPVGMDASHLDGIFEHVSLVGTVKEVIVARIATSDTTDAIGVGRAVGVLDDLDARGQVVVEYEYSGHQLPSPI